MSYIFGKASARTVKTAVGMFEPKRHSWVKKGTLRRVSGGDSPMLEVSGFPVSRELKRLSGLCKL